MVRHEMYDFSEYEVKLVLVSENYVPDDYMHSYDT